MTSWMKTAVVSVLACGLTAHVASAQWQLAPERYQKLSIYERAQYDKAAALLTAGNYVAAAAEFEKFKIQFPDSSQLSAMVLLRGYSLHQAKQRIGAIKAYNEVMDFFGDHIEDASCALYWMGCAYIEDGEAAKGLKSFKEMVEDKDYQKHPYAAGALRALADNHWNNKEYEQAIKYWRQCADTFAATNPPEANIARDNVFAYYIKGRNLTALEQWQLSDEKTRNDPKVRVALAAHALGLAHGGISNNGWGKYTDKNVKEKEEDIKALLQWYHSYLPWFEKSGDKWSYYTQLISFMIYVYNVKDEREKLIDEAMAFVKASADVAKDKKTFDPQYSWLCDAMRDAGLFARARFCAAQLTDPMETAWKEYTIRGAEQKWDAAIAQLQDIEGRNNPAWKLRAMGERARIYKDVLSQFDKAIQVYQAISQPPGTLWAIVECYQRSGKNKEALATLTEIENMFPDNGPRAAWGRAAMYDSLNDSKQAIAEARRLIKAYPKSPESSSAHQLLEKYKIATGGGVMDEQ